MLYDFHTHTFFSDGSLSPVELIRRAVVKGYSVIGVTDHASPGNLSEVISQLQRDCETATRYWPVTALAGVELTHVPAAHIGACAALAKELGARLVIVHGETIVEPVEPGTNLAAVQCPHVDILAHPGFLTMQEAQLAAQHHIYIEITARAGHALTNGHVAKTALAAGAALLVDSDSHDPEDLLTPAFARQVAQGAGLAATAVSQILQDNPAQLCKKIYNK